MVIRLSECALSKEVFSRLAIKNLEKLQGALLGEKIYKYFLLFCGFIVIFENHSIFGTFLFLFFYYLQ
jgi:hypothetical protein